MGTPVEILDIVKGYCACRDPQYNALAVGEIGIAGQITARFVDGRRAYTVYISEFCQRLYDTAGVSVTWLDGLDWDTVSQYKDAVALDASVARRGIAVIAKSEQDAVSKFLGVRLYEPISEKRKSS